MHSKHTTSATQALYNVFVLPVLSKSAAAPRTALRCAIPKQHSAPLLRRSFHQSHIYLAKTREAEERTQKWNDEIEARLVQLVDGETNKLLDDGQPRTKWDVLNSFDHKTHRLVQLNANEPYDRNFIPVCRIVSKKEMYQRELARKKQGKDQKRKQKISSEMGAKTLELNWAIDQNNDLMHRLERMKAFLAEGRRVEITLASKRGGRRATVEECEQVLEKIKQAVGMVEGASERQEFQGKLGGFGSLIFQGKPIAGSQEKGVEGKEKDEE